MIIKEFVQQVERFGEKPAVRTGETTLTYNELNEKADNTAYQLIQLDKRLAENSDKQRVALLFDHGVDFIAALLAALKAGKTYIPLDVGHPEKRLSYILENAAVYLIITGDNNLDLALRLTGRCGGDIEEPSSNGDRIFADGGIERSATAADRARQTIIGKSKSPHKETRFSSNNSIEILNIDRIEPQDLANHGDNIDRQVPGDTPAYILYTSGSTGNPKGVVQSRQNVLHHARAWVRRFALTESDRLTLLASFSHDGSVPDIYASLLSGATLYPIDVKKTGTREIVRRLIEEKITLWHSVPTFYRYFTRQLNGDEGFADLRLIILGGEAVRRDDLVSYKRYFPHAGFANIYGQTESTVNSIWLVSHDCEFDRVELGEPVADTQMILVNDEGDIVGDMGTGEIVIAGPHTALGYWRDEKHTRKSFTHDVELGRLYWTGDLGRLTADGGIVLIGRKDFQVKIRGFRVELAEIETVLLRHEAVREAAAAVKTGPDGENNICVYVVPAPGKEGIAGELRGYLAKELPDFMMPGHFIMMDEIPLTPTGKIDRNNLPGPVEGKPAAPVYEAPGSEIERKLVSIWEQILGRENIGVNYNFIDLGGHSLLVFPI